jgi:hypothetical protein
MTRRPGVALALVAALAATPAACHGAAAMPLTLDLYNVSLRQAFDELARSCGLAFDYAGGVRTDRRMSIFLKDAEPESALYFALRANSLEMLPPQNGRVQVVPAADTDDTPIVVIGTGSMTIEVSKDDADVRQQRARMQLPPGPGLAESFGAGQADQADQVAQAVRAAQGAGTLLDWKIRPRSRVGSNFTVQLFLRAARPVDSVPLTVSFDGQAFEVMRVEGGDYWGLQSALASQVDRAGTITLDASRQAAAMQPGSASIANPASPASPARSAGASASGGLLASITFRAVSAAPAAHIQVVSARALDAEGKDVGVAVPLRHAMLVQP